MVLVMILAAFRPPLAAVLNTQPYSSGTLVIQNLPDTNGLIKGGKQPATFEDKDKPKPSVSLSADPTKVTEGFTVNMIAELTEASDVGFVWGTW